MQDQYHISVFLNTRASRLAGQSTKWQWRGGCCRLPSLLEPPVSVAGPSGHSHPGTWPEVFVIDWCQSNVFGNLLAFPRVRKCRWLP